MCFYLEFGKRGSILLEIAIALSIFGLISGFFVTKTIVTNRAMRAQVIKNNIAIVSVALASFVANNNRLPRPSHGNDGCECESDDSSLSNFVGKIPFSILGLPEKSTLDSRGKPLLYIVEPALTSYFTTIYGKGGVDTCFCDGFVSSILVDKVSLLKWNPIAFVLDVGDNLPHISQKINVIASIYTYWVPRDMLLMMYLKSGPCKKEASPTPAGGGRSSNPFDLI
ncbi:MAG: type II secretion system GspH family protein [Holosporaceae bacterium]|nr:type II secretion system GspH family protein [Holosporaceae bacterium]